MIRGFLAGSLALIALYVLVQPGVAEKVEQASGLSLSTFRRALSPQSAGVPNVRSKRAARAEKTSPGTAPSGGGLFQPVGI